MFHPYGAPPSVADAIARATVERYPDPTARTMREAVARFLHVRPGQVIAGNGSIEIIYLLAHAYLDPRRSRGDHRANLWRVRGCRAVLRRRSRGVPCPRRERVPSSTWPPYRSVIQAARPKLVFCCNPNNPTGQALDLSQVRTLLDAVGAVADCWSSTKPIGHWPTTASSPGPSLELVEHGPLMLLRSLTKDFALPGLRLGYAVAPLTVGERLNALSVPWAVNAFAEGKWGISICLARPSICSAAARTSPRQSLPTG